MYLVNLHPPFPPFPPFKQPFNKGDPPIFKGDPPIFKGGWVIGLTNPPLKRVVTSTLKGGPPLLLVDHPLKGGCIGRVDSKRVDEGWITLIRVIRREGWIKKGGRRVDTLL